MKSTNNNCDFMVCVCARNTDTTISLFKTKNGKIVIATINMNINDIVLIVHMSIVNIVTYNELFKIDRKIACHGPIWPNY